MVRRRKTSDALKILDRLTGPRKDLRKMIDAETLNQRVAQMIYDARLEANMTQRELAEAIGTRQTVIARLEDSNYRGHSLSILQRIAEALGLDLDVRFVDLRKKPVRAARS